MQTDKKEEGVMGSSTEGHISHVLSARMSSRLMGWSRQGADRFQEEFSLIKRLPVYVNKIDSEIKGIVCSLKSPSKVTLSVSIYYLKFCINKCIIITHIL